MKKTSETIHREHAEQKVKRNKEREAAGYKPHKGISLGASKKQENALSNIFAQILALDIKISRAKELRKAGRKREYKPRKV
jgi:hypothetical protein